MITASSDQDFEALLEFLKQNRGFDFTGYKRTTLERRVLKRMDDVGIAGYGAYLERLAADPGEFTLLFNTLLINVTRFFRDDSPWQILAETVIPAILQRVPDRQAIRVWSAGCASGEEAYTLAILFAEALGPDGFRDRVKIYATDADDHALGQARLGAYDDEQVEGIPEHLREKYLERSEARWVFRKELRRAVIFGRNDLVQDAPISRIDLLVCRNTLMYFTAATQSLILGRFHFALVDGGVLFLGRAETLLTQVNSFTPIDSKWRLFGKVGRLARRERVGVMTAVAPRELSDTMATRIRDSAFEAGGEAQVVVNRAGMLMMANERARVMFGLGRGDVGRPIQDLELSYRPVELRSMFERAYAERTMVAQREVKWRPRHASDDVWLVVEVSPLLEADGSTAGASVLFIDVTESFRLHLELEHARQNLETAYEELQSTNEELETTNEELQSTVEELETTNEELQSTNEELETMNEEFQSTNEELETMNDEVRRRGDEVKDAHLFLAAVFASMRGGVVVLDREMSVLVWNLHAEELWGLRGEEVVGTSFLGLDIGLPVERIAQEIRSVVDGSREDEVLTLDATNRRGRAIRCRVGIGPLRSLEGAVKGAIVTMEEQGSEG